MSKMSAQGLIDSAADTHSSKLIAKLKKTEIENQRFTLLEKGIDPVAINQSMARSSSDISAPSLAPHN